MHVSVWFGKEPTDIKAFDHSNHMQIFLTEDQKKQHIFWKWRLVCVIRTENKFNKIRLNSANANTLFHHSYNTCNIATHLNPFCYFLHLRWFKHDDINACCIHVLICIYIRSYDWASPHFACVHTYVYADICILVRWWLNC